jgi:hypothetical protein
MEDAKDHALMRLHKKLKADYPLPYEAAQMYPPIGFASAAMEAEDAIRNGNKEELLKAALSAVPVLGRAKIGNRIARSAEDVVGSGSLSNKVKTVVKKAGAGENTAEAGEAGYEQGQKMGFRKGGKVSASSRADGIAQRGKTRGKMR